MKKVAAALLAMAAIAGGIGVLHAANSESSCFAGMCGQFGKGRMLKAFLHKMADELELSAEQKEKIHTIVKREKPAVKGYVQRLRANHETMCKLQESGSVSDEAIEQYAQKQADIVAKLIVLHQKAKGEIRPILTEEQLTRIKKRHEEKRKCFDKFLADH